MPVVLKPEWVIGKMLLHLYSILWDQLKWKLSDEEATFGMS
jgi:hypothetical protein